MNRLGTQILSHVLHWTQCYVPVLEIKILSSCYVLNFVMNLIGTLGYVGLILALDSPQGYIETACGN